MHSQSRSFSYSVSAAEVISRAGPPDQETKSDPRYAVFALKLLYAFWGDEGLRDIYHSSNFELPQKASKKDDDGPRKEEDDIQMASQTFVEKTIEFIFCRNSAGTHRDDSVKTFQSLIMSWRDMDAVSPMDFFYLYDGKTPSLIKLEIPPPPSDGGYVSFESILARYCPDNTAANVFALESATCDLNSASGSAQLGLHDPGKKTFNGKRIDVGGESFAQTTKGAAACLDFSGQVYGAKEHHSNCFMVWLLRELGPQGLNRFLENAANGPQTLCLKLDLSRRLDTAEQLLLFLVSQLDHKKTAGHRRRNETVEAQGKTAQWERPEPADLPSQISLTPSGDDDDDEDEVQAIGGDLNSGDDDAAEKEAAAPGGNVLNSKSSLSSTTSQEKASFSASFRHPAKEKEEEDDEEAEEEDDEQREKNKQEKKRLDEKREEWNKVNQAAGGYRTIPELIAAASGSISNGEKKELTIRLTAEDSKFILDKYAQLCQEYGLLALQKREDSVCAGRPALYFHVMGTGENATISYTLTGFFLQEPVGSVVVPGASSALSTANLQGWYNKEKAQLMTIESDVPESVCVIGSGVPESIYVANVQRSFFENVEGRVETSSSSCSLCEGFVAHATHNNAGQALDQYITLDDGEGPAGAQTPSLSRCQCSISVATSSSGVCSVCCFSTAHAQRGPGVPWGEESSSSCHCESTNNHSCPQSLSKPGSSSGCSCCKSSKTSGGSSASSCTFCKANHSQEQSVVSEEEQCSCDKSSGVSVSQSTSGSCSACKLHGTKPIKTWGAQNSTTASTSSSSGRWCQCSRQSEDECPGCKEGKVSGGTNNVPNSNAQQPHGEFCHCPSTSARGAQTSTASAGGVWCQCSQQSEEECSGCQARVSKGRNNVPNSNAQQSHGDFCHCPSTSVSVSGAAVGQARGAQNSTAKSESLCKCSETPSEQCPECRDQVSSRSASGAAVVAPENPSVSGQCPYCTQGAPSPSSSNCKCSSNVSESSGFPASSKKAVVKVRRDYSLGQSCLIINLPVAF